MVSFAAMKDVLNALEEGILEVNRKGNVVFANAQGLSLLDDEALVGKNLQELVAPSEFAERCVEVFSRCQAHGIPIHEEGIKAIPYGRKVMLILQSKQSLGKDFIANASHELRTPITIIRGFAETMQDLQVISEAMLEDITEKIIRNCHRMNGLVKNLLILADLDHIPESNRKACDLVQLVEVCSHAILSIHPMAQIETLMERERMEVFADPDLLELAFMNLMENGVKYSEGAARLTVKMEQKGKQMVVSFSDQGVGIPEEDVGHIFRRFYTVNKSHSRKLGGAGLGLSIVQSIVEKHEGSISVTSKLGKGTTFTLIF